MNRFVATVARRRVPLGFVLGAVALWLARPTVRSVTAGAVFAVAGEAIRFWAAGHLEKGREVTTSGPYAWMPHPLYCGSALLGIGFAIASANLAVAALVAVYLGATMTAAIRMEEAWLRRTFGDAYDAYRAGAREAGPRRRFSLERALRNREHRTVVGVAVVLALLASLALRARYAV